MGRRFSRNWQLAAGAVILVALALAALTPVGRAAFALVTVGFLKSALQLSVPIAMAGVGGLYAEKSGVINIGIEGLLIAGAFASVYVTWLTVDVLGARAAVWVGFLAAILASTLGALLFAVICIEFKADQIIAGLAVWFLFLGLGPFASRAIWGQINSPTVATFEEVPIPVLSEIPVVGRLFFDLFPTTYMMLVVAPAAWYVLKYTRFGMWVRASGEHPEALDTAGVDVNRVRYASVTVSGILSGVGGASITLATVGQFIGQGQTIVNGRGFIGIVTYLMANYNPLGTFGAAILFAGLEAMEIRLQQVGIALPSEIIGVVPHMSVIVVLVFFGYTRMPSSAGENYQSGEES